MTGKVTVLWRLSQDSEIGFMGGFKMTEPQIRLGPWLESSTAVSKCVSDGTDGCEGAGRLFPKTI